MSSSSGRIDAAAARVIARRFTKGRVRSRRELAERLRRAGASAAVAASAARECEASGCLDDQACARLWADHLARQGYAWSAIRERLVAKGLEAEIIERAAEAVGCGRGQDAARIRHIAAAESARPADGAASRRFQRWLIARGFDPELVEQIVSDRERPFPAV